MNSQQTQQNIAVPSLNLLKVQKFKDKQDVIKDIIAQDKMGDKNVKKEGQREQFYKPNAKSMALQHSLDNQTHSPKNSSFTKAEIQAAAQVHEEYPRLFKKKQALQELREIQKEVAKCKKPIIMNKNSSSQNINVSRQLGKHQKRDSQNQGIFKNEISQQQIQQSTHQNLNGLSINEIEKRFQQQISVMEHEYDIDGETAANSANQYPTQKLQSHLKDLAQLQNDLNRLNNDQKLSKNNFEKMKMFFKRNNTRSRLKQRGGPHDEEASDVNNKSSKRNKNKSSSFDYYNDESKRSGNSQDYSEIQSNLGPKEGQTHHKNQSTKHLTNQRNNIEKHVKTKCQFETQKYDTSLNDLSVVQQRLKKECKGDLGIVNPMKAFSILNMIQKEDCPEAYEPEIVTLHKQKLLEKQRIEEYNNDVDKTLFDFDDDIDKLSNVSERYQVQGFYLVEDPQVNNKTIQESKQENSLQTDEQSKYKQRKKKTKDVNFEIDQVKAEMIKDLSYYNKNKRDDSDSPRQDNFKNSKPANQNQGFNIKSRKNENDRIISSIKQQRRNVFNHQPLYDEPLNKSYSRKNRASQGMSQGLNRYKPNINRDLGNLQERVATSAAPKERNLNDQLSSFKKDAMNFPPSNIKSDINVFKQKNERPQIPSTLERPGACVIKDIYGQMSKMNYESHFKNTMMILDQQSQFSRPLTSNNRINTNKQNLFNQNSSIIQSGNDLQLTNILNQRPKNQIPFQNLNPAFSEVALNNSLNQYQYQQQNNSAYVASKKGTLYPGITANHKHIDRIEKYFCSNIQKKTTQLQSQAEQQKKQLQHLKFQQSKLIGTSINLGDNVPLTSLNTVTHLGSISSKRRLHQHELFI
ncbi:UNKNOWN [Stylonychia lemnae]|uniref:Uncharacterized protein n=1 Tax=Stylonychia lemnae TaxID=5949 RepID=A0A078AZF6_STYLE|nr:UNKNOWN [Stylonychia lemnae]|eukprot:CDW87820.1 UNKNOWN [Stylonychia lemnae]